MTATALVLVFLLAAAVAYGAYLAAIIKDDGLHSRRQPPASHPRDMFEPTWTA